MDSIVIIRVIVVTYLLKKERDDRERVIVCMIILNVDFF